MIAIIDYDAGNIKSVEKSTSLSWGRNNSNPRSTDSVKCRQSYSAGRGKLWTGNGESSYIRTCTCDP